MWTKLDKSYKNLKYWQKDGIKEFRTYWKQYTPLKLRFAGGIIILVCDKNWASHYLLELIEDNKAQPSGPPMTIQVGKLGKALFPTGTVDPLFEFSLPQMNTCDWL